ncbi:hypothetical protein D3C84_1189400 [compost metagenome]
MRRHQFHAVAAGGHFDLEGVLDIEFEIEGDHRVTGEHDVAHVEVLSRPNAIAH